MTVLDDYEIGSRLEEPVYLIAVFAEIRDRHRVESSRTFKHEYRTERHTIDG
jgi:hypothetical protein